MNDNYFHNDMNLLYITESIPGPPEDSIEYDLLLANYNSQMLDNCYCNKMCMKAKCRCLHISHGDNYCGYSFDGILKYRLNHKLSLFKDYPVIECNSNCLCPATCGNRIVQFGPMEGLIVKECDEKEKGLGLFTSLFIHKGTFVCEYAGELLTKTQALSRTEENEAQGNMNYIFCLNEYTYEGLVQTYVDPSKFGNIGRYINHSCEPNCSVVPVRTEIAIPRLALFACKDIDPDEEITFRYSSGSEAVPDNKTDSALARKPCLCYTETCEKFMPCENF